MQSMVRQRAQQQIWSRTCLVIRSSTSFSLLGQIIPKESPGL